MSDIVETHTNGASEETTNGFKDSTSSAELLALKHQDSDSQTVEAVAEAVEELKIEDTAPIDTENVPVQKPKPAKLDIASDEAFPSLGPAKAAPKVPVPSWSRVPTALPAGSFPAKKPLSHTTDRIIELTTAEMILEKDLDGKTFGAVLKIIMDKSGVKIERQGIRTGGTRIMIKGGKEAVDRAEHAIRSQLTRRVKRTIQVPVKVRSFVIGKGGETIRHIEDLSGAKVILPKADKGEKKETPATPPVRAEGDDDDDEETVEVTLEGSEYSVEKAARAIEKIVADKRPPVERTMEGIRGHFYPFLAEKVKELAGPKLRIDVPLFYLSESPAPNFSHGKPIVIRGDKAAVQHAKQALLDEVARLGDDLAFLQTKIPHSQHRFIIGTDGKSLVTFKEQTGCSIVIPPPNKKVDQIYIIGTAEKLGNGVAVAKERAAAMTLVELDISRAHPNAPNGAVPHAWDIVRLFQETDELSRIQQQYGVDIEIPQTEAEPGLPIRIFGPSKTDTDAARQEVVNLVSNAKPAKFRQHPVDPAHHKHLNSEQRRKVKEQFDVTVVLTEEDGVALLAAGNNTEDASKALEDAWTYIQETIAGFPQVYTKTLDIPAEQQAVIIGPNGTTLNCLISGEVLVTVGTHSKNLPGRKPKTAKPNQLVVRGCEAEDVDATIKNITTILKQLEAGENINEAVKISLEFPQKIAGILIGHKGSNVNKYKDQFGVDVQINNEGRADLRGPKHNVEVVRRKLVRQIKIQEDTATVVLNVPTNLHSSIIGHKGKLVKRLEEKYQVRIKFPKSSHSENATGNGEPSRPDEIIIKGPKKGVAEVKKEIDDLLQYEMDNGHTAKVQIISKNCRPFVGANHLELRRLREETGAVINIPNLGENGNVEPDAKVDIKVRGTKSAVAQIVKELNKWIKELDSRKTVNLTIPKKFHKSLIGQRGNTLRDIVVNAGGPEDRSAQAKIVRFPHADSQSSDVKVEGSADLVDKIVESLNKLVHELENKVTITVDVPQVSHRKLIGREGAVRKEIEKQFNVGLDIPKQGSSSTGVKISGSQEAVDAAKAHIAELIKGDEGETIKIPAALANELLDGGHLQRELRNHNVTLDYGKARFAEKKQVVRSANGGDLPSITSEDSKEAFSWTLEENAKAVEDDVSEVSWMLRGTEENIAKAKEIINKAIETAKKQGFTGYLIISDPSQYRLIVGPGGSTVNGIRKESGCKITIPRTKSDGEAIIINGTKEGAEKAKDIILELITKKQ